jgi:hypothetical protein
VNRHTVALEEAILDHLTAHPHATPATAAMLTAMVAARVLVEHAGPMAHQALVAALVRTLAGHDAAAVADGLRKAASVIEARPVPVEAPADVPDALATVRGRRGVAA